MRFPELMKTGLEDLLEDHKYSLIPIRDTERSLIMGRGKDCDIKICGSLSRDSFDSVYMEDKKSEHEKLADYFLYNYVSKKHLKLLFKDEIAYVADLGSTNGTYLNEVRIGKYFRRLSNNQRLMLGPYHFKILIPDKYWLNQEIDLGSTDFYEVFKENELSDTSSFDISRLSEKKES